MTARSNPKFLLTILIATLAFGGCAESGTAQDETLETVEQRASYAIGFNIGRQLANDAKDADIDLLVKGLRDAMAKSDPLLSEEDMQQAVMELQEKMMTANQAAGSDYLSENKTKDGVQVTDSGLQYEVITEGSGAKPGPTDTVRVHYEGTTIQGDVFDSSLQRGEPVTFPLNRVIAGWTEALQLMPVGSKWKLTIPPELAYGANPPPGATFGPNAVLIFEVELLGIEE